MRRSYSKLLYSHLVSALAFLGILLATSGAIAQAVVSFPDRVCDVTQFGAEGTKLWYDTEAFQKAIDACAKDGGGMVLVPRGTYLIGPIFLKSNIRLTIAKYAEVLAASDPKLYGTTQHPMTPEGKSADLAFINIRDAENVAITGEGLIDGQGAVWWEWMRDYWRSDKTFAVSGEAHQQQHDSRPRLVMVRGSRNVLFQGVTFANSPSFNLVLQKSDAVTISHVSILAPAHAPNTDAIDPIDTRNVLIENNTISCGDDVVAIKGNGPDLKYPNAVSSNIVIRDNTILQGRGISIGSGTSGGVSHVLAENNTFDGSMYGFRIKTRRGHGGDVSDIVFRNNKMTNVQTVMVISGYYEYKPFDPKEAARQVKKGGFILGNQLWPPDRDPARPFVADQTPNIHDVAIESLTATGADRAGVATGLPEKSISGLRLKNVHIEAETGLLVRHADVVADHVEIVVKSGKAVTLQKGGKFKQETTN